jgi:hypothetical protein
MGAAIAVDGAGRALAEDIGLRPMREPKIQICGADLQVPRSTDKPG